MKKNMLTVIILALCFINMILTALVVFVVVPSSKRTDKLVKQVASVIDLELPEEEDAASKVGILDIQTYNIEKQLTINLKKTEDDKSVHFAVIDTITLSLDKNAKGFKKLSATLADNEVPITEIVSDVISQYTFEEAPSKRNEMKEEVLRRIQEDYGSDFVISVAFGNPRFQ